MQRLYRATADTLFGVALRILRHPDWAEEVLQESFVSVWRTHCRLLRFIDRNDRIVTQPALQSRTLEG